MRYDEAKFVKSSNKNKITSTATTEGKNMVVEQPDSRSLFSLRFTNPFPWYCTNIRLQSQYWGLTTKHFHSSPVSSNSQHYYALTFRIMLAWTCIPWRNNAGGSSVISQQLSVGKGLLAMGISIYVQE